MGIILYHIMKKMILLPVILVLFSACQKEDIKTIPGMCSDFLLYYSSGSGWTGNLFEITVLYPDTLRIYDRKMFYEYSERSVEYFLSSGEIDTLLADLRKLINIDLVNYGFGPDKPTDQGTVGVKYRICTYADSCCIYVPDEGEVPDELYTLTGHIVQFAGNHDPVLRNNLRE